MQFEGIPKEYIERDLEREKTKGIFEIAEKIKQNYDYEGETKGFSAQTVYTIELAVASAEKYRQAYQSIGKISSAYSPELARQLCRILEDMLIPDNQ